MTKLVIPNAGVSFPLTRGGSSTQLITGGTSKISRTRTRRTYQLSWGDRVLDDLDPILGFYSGLRGEGPFCLIDPAWRNLLSHTVSTFGRQLQALSGWSATASASIGYDATFDPYGATVPGGNSGVLKWTAPSNGDYLFEGAMSAGVVIPDVDTATRAGRAVPYLPDQPCTLSVGLRTYSSTASIRLVAFGLSGAGAPISSATRVNGPTLVIGSGADTLASLVVPVGQAGWSASATPYICMALQVMAAGAGNVAVSCAMTQMGVSTPSGWVQGLGVPRMVILNDNPAAVNLWDRQTQAMTLAEI